MLNQIMDLINCLRIFQLFIQYFVFYICESVTVRLGTFDSVRCLRLRKKKKKRTELRLGQKEKIDFENVINMLFIDQQQRRIGFRSTRFVRK